MLGDYCRPVVAMRLLRWLQQYRDWVPVPDADGRLRLRRWVLLEGSRMAVAGALLTFVYVALMSIGIIWPLEMQVLLTETSTVETVLVAFLSGIILLVSIVVSINSIVLSQDMTSVDEQEERIRGTGEFWQDVNDLTDTAESPSNLRSFLEVVTTVITENAEEVTRSADGLDPDLYEEVQEYADSVTGTVDHLHNLDGTRGADFALLWTALEVKYGPLLDRTHVLQSQVQESHPESYNDSLNSLLEGFQLFAVGREYFKTMYYTREVSRLSRVLLIISLPIIVVTASAILAISADLFPNWWVLGLPPLHSFVATTFTIALLPYIVLTSFMLRLSTVAKRTNTEGLVSMH